MGVFDLFGRNPKTKDERGAKYGENAKPDFKTKNGPVAVFEPTSFKDVEKIIDSFKNGKNAVVHLGKLKQETALRVIDMLSGAIYALDGGVYEMEENIYMFSPMGVEIL